MILRPPRSTRTTTLLPATTLFRSSLTRNPRVIELEQSQPGGSFDSPIPPFEPYRLTHVDNARISRGRVAYHANRQTLRAIEQETGVPEAVMEIGRASCRERVCQYV